MNFYCFSFTIIIRFGIILPVIQERKEGPHMPKTVVKDNETIEDALRRFKRDVSRSGTLREARKREYYLKPSVSKKMRRKANAKRK